MASILRKTGPALVLVPACLSLFAANLAAPASPGARSGHSLTNVNGDIYLFGGMTEETASGRGRILSMPSNDLWKFDGENHDWEVVDVPVRPPARSEHAAAACNGQIYIFGGTSGAVALGDVWRFDPELGTWTEGTWVGPYPLDTYDMSAATIGNYIYLYGGRKAAGNPWCYGYRYNPGSGAAALFSSGTGPGPRYGHTSAAIGNQFCVFGGYGGSTPPYQYFNDVWCFNLSSFTWTRRPILGENPAARSRAASVVSGTNWWIFGGEGEGGAVYDDAWVTNLAVGKAVWALHTQLSGPRTQSSAARIGKNTVIFGGWDGQTYRGDTEIYRTSPVSPGDFDGDGIDDIVVFRPSTGLWSVRNLTRFYFGSSNDAVVPGDYDGDGTSDAGVFRAAMSVWVARNVTRVYIGSPGDVSVPGDYDGDGRADPALYRGSLGLWVARNVTRVYLGASTDTPIPADYDGDGIADPAIFRPANGMWSVRDQTRFYCGSSSDVALPADYRGTGMAEAGIYRPADGLWSVRNLTRLYFGASDDTPVPADYDANGLADPAVFRPASGLWSVRDLTRVFFGSTGDIPATRQKVGVENRGG